MTDILAGYVNEKFICKMVIDLLTNDVTKGKFGIEERTDSYTTLVFCDNDFFRVKYTDKAKWISIRLAKEDRKPEDKRFEAQENKNQLHWKANINNWEDIVMFEDVLKNACVSMVNDTYTERNINHGKIDVEAKAKEKGITLKINGKEKFIPF